MYNFKTISFYLNNMIVKQYNNNINNNINVLLYNNDKILAFCCILKKMLAQIELSTSNSILLIAYSRHFSLKVWTTYKINNSVESQCYRVESENYKVNLSLKPKSIHRLTTIHMKHTHKMRPIVWSNSSIWIFFSISIKFMEVLC